VGAAQTGTNIGTAIANTMLNNYNQKTPFGSLAFDQTGSYTYTDPQSDEVYDIPRFTATQKMSRGQQKLFNQTEEVEQKLAGLANTQTDFLTGYMKKPWDGSNDETEQRLFELGRKRLDPLQAEQRQTRETQLANQGIRQGSAAWDRAMGLQGQQENDATNQLLLAGHGQAFQEGLTQRNQPINEIIGLMSGTQVQQPNFIGTNQQQIPTTDYAGLQMQDYQNQMQRWQQQQGATQSMLGGLFGLGASALMSDRRLKTDIEKVGKTDDGLPIFRYRYKAGGPMQLGLMAQDVEKTKPEAVITTPSGYKAVDYGRAL
jgi:hypothetical protein